MPEQPTPREVVEAVMRGIADEAWSDLHVWYADDAVIDYPFGLPQPSRLEGIDAIRDYFAGASKLPVRLRARDMVVHQTADPEVVIAEWDYDGLVKTTGRAFQVSNIQVSRVRDGKIVTSRDYHNHAAMAEAMGRLPRLVAAMTGETP
jgi:ketosteroid isomerase-like protein